jgi:ATP-binding cassette subfamily C protein
MIAPQLSGGLIDALSVSSPYSSVLAFFFAAAILWTIDAATSFMGGLVGARLRSDSTFALNQDVLEHVKRLPLAFFRDVSPAYLTQRINGDAWAVISFATDNAASVATNAVTMLAIAAFAFASDPSIGIIATLAVPAYCGVWLAYRKSLYRKNLEYKESQNVFFGALNEQLANVRMIKANSWYELRAAALRDGYRGLLAMTMSYFRINLAYSTTSTTISRLPILALIAIGSAAVLDGKASLGAFTALLTYVGMMLGSAGYFLGLGRSWQETRVSFDRIRELFDRVPEPDGDIRLERVTHIDADRLSFRFEENDPLIENLSFSIKRGEIALVLGANGCGKSSLASILLGLYRPSSGTLSFEGLDTKSVDMASTRRLLISATEQEPALLPGTLAENLTYGLDPGIGERECLRVCKELGAAKWIATLPGGLSTRVESVAQAISGGEKQKISLARAFLKEHDILLLDEPTSALDAESVSLLAERLNRDRGRRITILITHDARLVRLADVIIELARGVPAVCKRAALEIAR